MIKAPEKRRMHFPLIIGVLGFFAKPAQQNEHFVEQRR
jgi:hypothetical protein